MGVAWPAILQLVKLSVIGFVLAFQGSSGFSTLPSPATFPVISPTEETPGPVRGESWRSTAPSSASYPEGFVISPSPGTSSVIPPPGGTPGPVHPRDSWRSSVPSSPFGPNAFQTTEGLEPFMPPRIPTLSPPYEAAPPASTLQGHVPSAQPSLPQTKAPVSTPVAPAPAAVASGTLPRNGPASHASVGGSLSPSAHKKSIPQSKPHIPEPISPAPITMPSGNFPNIAPAIHSGIQRSLPPSSHKKTTHIPEPMSPAPVSLPSGNLPIVAPASHSSIQGSLPPIAHEKRTPANKAHIPEPMSPAPVALPSRNLPIIAPASHSTIQASLPPTPHMKATPANKVHAPEPISPGPVALPSGNLPIIAPASQPSIQGSLPPSPHKKTTPANKAHTPEPILPAPAAIPPRNLPETAPASQPSIEGSLPPSPNKKTPPENKAHTHDPISPVSVASPPWKVGQNPPATAIVPKVAPSILPAPAVSPETEIPLNPLPGNLPETAPASQPSIEGSLPPSPNKKTPPENKAHTHDRISSGNLPETAPASQPSIEGSLPPSPNKKTPPENKAHTHGLISPVSVASPPWKVGQNPPATAIVPKVAPSILPAPAVSPETEIPLNPSTFHPVTPAVSPSTIQVPVVSPASTPASNFNKKRVGIPVSAPQYEKPKPLPPLIQSPDRGPSAHDAMGNFDHAPGPSSSSNSPLEKGYHSPAAAPSNSFYKHHHSRNRITSPSPTSYLVSPPTSNYQGPVIPPSLVPSSGWQDHAPPPWKPGFSVSPSSTPRPSPESQVSPAPALSTKAASHPTRIPLPPPIISPSGNSSKIPKMPLLPPIQTLPPPPPNEDCSSYVCSEPYTNTPPGSPCGCVWPMQVGLRLSVSLYTFFPLVSELAAEIAAGLFMKQSQVRIMGANVANQQPDKTVVLIDLVPLGEKFDNTTAFLTYDRFWHKQVVIKASYFGDYDVLYVSYPGLPQSPPLPPSSITIIDGGPFSSNDNNGRKIKPLGVDVHKRRHKDGLSRGIIAIIALSVFIAVSLCAAAAWVLLFRRRDHVCQPGSTPRALPASISKPSGTAGSLIESGLSSASLSFGSSIAAYTGSAKTFTMSDIQSATHNFDASRIIGEGGFGRVYSGLLDDGMKVAVKVLKRDDQQGGREFLAEVEMLSRLHHRNLVKLIGICAEDRARCLVYELIPNGSVESHLHGVDKETAPLNWGARTKIALGAARGLAYLHEDSSPRVIHRDFKSSNILLEHDFTPKVSDFGLARSAMDEENSHISTRVMGTFGYVAPEYAMTGHLLVKSDVYSYGVVLLELLTGRKPVDMSQPPGQENLVAWARPLLTSKEGLETIIDPCLGSDVPFESVAKVAAIASMCVQPEVSNRPFMGEVVQALKLVCNECDEARESNSRCSSEEDMSINLETGVSTVSGQIPDNFRSQNTYTAYNSGLDIEGGLSASELFNSSARLARQASGSFRRHSYSGPLKTGRSRQFWHIMKRFSGGSVSEHGVMFSFWQGSH
ncbi:Protein kinase [Quillaja saponaria]|uniref:Protein kinase n=1 Tax=Quillaja saponaria TaxID=32244 RepID=A0AAD7LDT4_QUISA|nr:Protein kinase [Quillaja saponaria]